MFGIFRTGEDAGGADDAAVTDEGGEVGDGTVPGTVSNCPTNEMSVRDRMAKVVTVLRKRGTGQRIYEYGSLPRHLFSDFG